MTHTPAPWKYRLAANSYGENGAFVVVRDTRDGEQVLICHMPYQGFKSSHITERKANARLIAAAPELLEALEAMSGAFDTPIARRKDCSDFSNEARELCRTAIAKAKGQSNE